MATHAMGTWYLAPVDDRSNDYAAGYDGNVFATEDEALAEIPHLRACGEEFAATEWVAVQREGQPNVECGCGEWRRRVQLEWRGQDRHRGRPCVPLETPAPGTTYRLERYEPCRMGLPGDCGVTILDSDGRYIAGVIDSRAGCERLLRIRGFGGPFAWPTPAESKAARMARRKGGAD